MNTQTMVQKDGTLIIVPTDKIDFRNGELKTISQALIQRHPRLNGLRCLPIIERATNDYNFTHIGQVERFFHV